MIDLQGVRETIDDIKLHGNSMADLRDLNTLYQLEKHLMCDGYGGGMGEEAELSRSDAEAWVSALQNEDPAKPSGGKWTIDQVKPIAQKYGVPTEGNRFYEFWAMMNVMYSDYYAIAKKYNALNPDFFADMAMAFINDKDAAKDKVAVYYNCIAKH